MQNPIFQNSIFFQIYCRPSGLLALILFQNVDLILGSQQVVDRPAWFVAGSRVVQQAVQPRALCSKVLLFVFSLP